MPKYFIEKLSSTGKHRYPGRKTLVDTRKKTCEIAKHYKGYRIGIYEEDKSHIVYSGTSKGKYGANLVEDIEYRPETDDFYLVQWKTNRHYRVSPKTGRLLNMSREWKYL